MNYEQSDLDNLYEEYKYQLKKDSIKNSLKKQSKEEFKEELKDSSKIVEKFEKVENNPINNGSTQENNDFNQNNDSKLEIKKQKIFLSKDKLINYNDKYNVIFYCPKNLKEGETERVSVSISKLDSNIIKTNIINFINDERKQKSQSLITEKDIEEKHINLLDSVKVDLIDPSGRVKIISDNQSVWRKVDSTNQEWYWYLTPNKDEGGKSPVSIYLNVSTKDNVNVLTKPFIIKIDLPETIWQAFLRKLRDIGWVITILGSIIGFFIGKKNK